MICRISSSCYNAFKPCHSARRSIFGPHWKFFSFTKIRFESRTISHFCAVACLHDIIIFVNAQLSMQLCVSMTVSRNTHPILCVFSSISWLFDITKCLLSKRNIQFILNGERKRTVQITVWHWHMQCARSETIGVFGWHRKENNTLQMWSGDHTTKTTTATATEKKPSNKMQRMKRESSVWKRSRKISATSTSQKFV